MHPHPNRTLTMSHPPHRHVIDERAMTLAAARGDATAWRGRRRVLPVCLDDMAQVLLTTLALAAVRHGCATPSAVAGAALQLMRTQAPTWLESSA